MTEIEGLDAQLNELADASSSLTPEERADLCALEQEIRRSWQAFVHVGESLLEVRDRRLYRGEYRTFGDYCEQVWGWSRQRAQQLIEGSATAQTLSQVGLEVATERAAREMKGPAAVIAALEPEMQRAVAKFLTAASGSDAPTTAQIKAVAEVVQTIDAHGTVQHPDTGAEVPFSALNGEQRAAVVVENVTNGTHERMQRQQQHIQTSVQQRAATGNVSWSDWCINYAQQQLADDQMILIEVRRDASGNVRAVACVANDDGLTIATGEDAPYLKKAVLNLVEVVK